MSGFNRCFVWLLLVFNTAAIAVPVVSTPALATPSITATSPATSIAPTSSTTAPAPSVATAPVTATTTSLATVPTTSTSGTTPTVNSASAAIPTNLSLILPINVAHDPKIALAVTIPAHFQTLTNPQQMPGFSMEEFIPANETGDNWTQIITTNSFINKKLVAAQFIDYMQKRFQETVRQVTVVDSSLDNYPDYQRSCTTMDYQVNKRHEMVAMCYYSGPYDAAGIQYAMLYPADNPPKADVAKKLETFLKAQTQVLNEEKPMGS